jgi:hypothetical protein
MFVRFVALSAAALLLSASVALADGIDPGLWKITTRIESGGVVGPPHETQKCLTAEQTRDVATTFSPVSRTINSECAPLERSFVGTRLAWKLVCKGQLNMELAGDFTFDGPRHYSATVDTKAAMAGTAGTNTKNLIEAEWVSQCP